MEDVDRGVPRIRCHEVDAPIVALTTAKEHERDDSETQTNIVGG